MNFIKLLQWLFFSICIFLYCSHRALADTIYQWTDPWGQVKYSKTQVQGSMLSELTELPKSQVSTEQQKQEAMVKKMQKIQNVSVLYQQKETTEKLLKQQKIIKKKHCQILQNKLKDIQLKNSRRYYPDNYYFPRKDFYPAINYYHRRYEYDLLENDLYKEIREYCR